MARDTIPADVRRQILVEAGHRCAIPTCRATTTEIAHIVPWAQSKDNSAANLIALCPNCHARFDMSKEIDQKSIRMYKHNLAILNSRYGEFERRMFEYVARNKVDMFMVGAGGDLLLANAVKDGIFKDLNVKGMNFDVQVNGQPYASFPMQFTYTVTPLGMIFIQKFAEGLDIE